MQTDAGCLQGARHVVQRTIPERQANIETRRPTHAKGDLKTENDHTGTKIKKIRTFSVYYEKLT